MHCLEDNVPDRAETGCRKQPHSRRNRAGFPWTGNITTGYSWNFKIGDPGVLELADIQFTSSDAKPGVVGAGGTYTWDFRALKPGTTTIVFTYSQSWNATASPQDKTVKVTVTVK